MFSLESFLEPELKKAVTIDLSKVELPTIEELEGDQVFNHMLHAEIALDAALKAMSKIESLDKRYGENELNEFTVECLVDEVNVSTGGVITFEKENIFDKAEVGFKIDGAKVAEGIKVLAQKTRLIIRKLIDALARFFSDMFDLGTRRLKQTKAVREEIKQWDSFKLGNVRVGSGVMPIMGQFDSKGVAIMTVSMVKDVIGVFKTYDLDKNLKAAADLVTDISKTEVEDKDTESTFDKLVKSFSSRMADVYPLYREEEYAGKQSHYLSLNTAAEFNNGIRIFDAGAKSYAMVDIATAPGAGFVSFDQIKNNSQVEVDMLLGSAEVIFESISGDGRKSVKAFNKGLEDLLKEMENKEGIPANRVRLVGQAGKFLSSYFRAEQQYLHRFANASLILGSSLLGSRKVEDDKK